MGHHGWQGNPPHTEDDAKLRIIAATRSCVEKFGAAKTTVSVVATELGVTRQTVYRYYPSHSELLEAVAQAGLADFVQRMTAHLATFDSAADVAIESIVWSIEEIPREPSIGLLLQAGETEVFSRDVTTTMSFSIGADILRDIPVDWSAIGVQDDELEGLAEMLMRLFVSLLQYPADPPRSADDIRSFVRRWLGPALNA
ncbi:AcrR family transcriptional regulator [Aeromicrobium panaciterrae]|uniref:AcrR family transcriptional regulator n=1 Tax=Aeromicrobium panaciterrae TaxID=363861 RepID=A0ABU1UJL8_9ACTN|nr:TetR/AcrR family transcriptional regulator [Aeromicrobium panaciterrae]MDR7085377.1 AcrR family transcriptional regulator [Aeromicrobium panaciterrae]